MYAAESRTSYVTIICIVTSNINPLYLEKSKPLDTITHEKQQYRRQPLSLSTRRLRTHLTFIVSASCEQHLRLLVSSVSNDQAKFDLGIIAEHLQSQNHVISAMTRNPVSNLSRLSLLRGEKRRDCMYFDPRQHIRSINQL